MSFEQKYLKYKSKYLALKGQAKNLQKGGSKNESKSFYGKNVMDIENLSLTPSMMESYGYNLVGGFTKNDNTTDLARLSKLLTESEQEINTTELSQSTGSETKLSETDISETELSQSAGSEINESNSELSEVDALTDTPTNNPNIEPETRITESHVKEEEKTDSKLSEQKSESQKTDSELSEQKSESQKTDSELVGGKDKAKSNKKYFFDDSDFELNSTTTDSELSSLDSDSADSDSSDIDL
jgi:hypothetical protein